MHMWNFDLTDIIMAEVSAGIWAISVFQEDDYIIQH